MQSVPSFYFYVGAGGPAQVTGLAQQVPYLLSLLTGEQVSHLSTSSKEQSAYP